MKGDDWSMENNYKKPKRSQKELQEIERKLQAAVEEGLEEGVIPIHGDSTLDLQRDRVFDRHLSTGCLIGSICRQSRNATLDPFIVNQKLGLNLKFDELRTLEAGFEGWKSEDAARFIPNNRELLKFYRMGSRLRVRYSDSEWKGPVHEGKVISR
jgi:hypothetical protein